MTRHTWLGAIVALAACPAFAQPTINGTTAGDESLYGAALSTQNTRTQFGDGSGNPDPIITGSNLAENGGSEIDQVFATVSGDRLYVLVAGNLEGNFNKLNLFIDSAAGGVNTLDGDALPGGLDGFCCGGFPPPKGGNTDNIGGLQNMHGLTFDAGFTADYALAFTHGRETVNPGMGDAEAQFWGLSAHYADLTQGTAGAVGGLGMQLAPRGEPRVLRAAGGPADGDFNDDGFVDAADYAAWRDNLGAPAGTLPNDPNEGPIGAEQYQTWRDNYGQAGGADGALSDFPFVPFGNPGNTESLISDFTLEGLGQGELIDRDYALSAAGGCADDTGAGCAAREFEFALDVDPNEMGTNDSSHRNFNNFVDLRLAIDNSNTAGVQGSGGDDFSIDQMDPSDDNPEDVVTGIEFSIPLSEIGASVGGGDIRIVAFVNSNDFTFASNQFGGDGLETDVELNGDFGVLQGSAGNLGNAIYDVDGQGALLTLEDIGGEQFVTVMNSAVAAAAAPEPSSGLLLAIAGVGAAWRRSRRAAWSRRFA